MTSASRPQPMKLRAASRGLHTMGSSASLNDVLSTTGSPVNRRYTSMSDQNRVFAARDTVWTRADPST